MSAEIDKRVLDFIRRHHVLTVATSGEGVLHCASLFYTYSDGVFVVTSSLDTLHARNASEDPCVAGSVVLETGVVGKLQGLQFRGKMYVPDGEELKKARNAYLKKFPFAVVMDLDLWVIVPDYMKFTDNRLGFGKKIIWER